MTTKAQQTKAITEAVNAYFNSGKSLDETAMVLSQNGILFTDIQSTIQNIGIKNEWVLTPEKIKAKVETALKGKVVSHFLDVVQIAKDLELPQMSIAEKQQAIVEFGKIEKSIAKEPRKFRQFHNSGNHGKIAEWIKAHPEFTAKELHDSGVITAPNASDYYDEFLAYREFFRA